jgi:hypothetical protein
MANRREAGPSARYSYGRLGLDWDDREERDPTAAGLPLKLTEERIRAESQRVGNLEDIGDVPLVAAKPAVAPAAQPDPGPPASASAAGGVLPAEPRLRAPAVGAPPVEAQPESQSGAQPRPQSGPTFEQPPRRRSILGLDDTLLLERPAPGAPLPDSMPDLRTEPALMTPAAPVIRPVRPSRALWKAVAVLSLALAGGAAYAYQAVREHSVIVSQLPGASAARVVRAEAVAARFKFHEFEQSRFATEVVAVGHRTRPALAAASERVQQFLGGVYDRYEQWRARRR